MRLRPGRRAALVSLVAVVSAGVVALAIHAARRPTGYEAYAGDAACLSCHQDQRAYPSTAHRRSSAPATRATVAGPFDAGASTVRTTNPYLHFRMEARGEALYQTAVTGMPPDTAARTERMELVVGSGRKGQSYLSWRDGDRLFQLPVSYWASPRGWITSPGFTEGVANFDRPVTPRCLECHATYFEPVDADPAVVNRYHPERQIAGIGCERCHGPGAEHADRATSPLRRILGSAMVDPARLPRERRIELCAQCHGGVGEPVAPSFGYLPGEPLDEHLRLPRPLDPREAVDVHGNQVALLERSVCFQASEMTCSTCHDVHRTERDPETLSARCLGCHQPRSCGLFPERGQAIVGGCVDCHMPELPSSSIVARRDGEPVHPLVRTHWIRVYERSLAR